ncbi:putative histidine kinase 4 [Erysiphe necator]|nr:putative histidine kinase 4 [Erysiphe necator]
MVSCEAPPKLSHIEGISDYARARELYKYYQPSVQTYIPTFEAVENEHDINISSNVSSSKLSSPDTALTVFCQLTAWRMGFQRAMISLIDAETQYFVAESTRTLDLINNDVHAPGDGLWLGCSSVAKAGRLCESTIAVAATKDNTYPHFIVNDLSKDERFNQLPFVSGPPFLKRYIGVPLITKRGIPIGSLFVVDDRLGDGLSEENLAFLGTMAKTVMRHFELVREVEEHRRAMKMSHGLSSLIEGRDELFETNIEKSDTEETNIGRKSKSQYSCCDKRSRDSIMNQRSCISKKNAKQAVSSEKREKNVHDIKMTLNCKVPGKVDLNKDNPKISQSRSIENSCPGIASSLILDKIAAPPENDLEDLSIRALFSRAAHLIQMTFELDGGTVFYDARAGSSETVSVRKTNSTPSGHRINSQFGSECSTSDDELEPLRKLKSKANHGSAPQDLLLSGRSTRSKPENSFYPHSNITMNKRVEILGYSTSGNPSTHEEKFPGHQFFKPLRHKNLQRLLRQYPRGKIWAFNADGTDSSSEQSSRSVGKNSELCSKGAQSKTRLRTNFLSWHFPGVRQLLFIPLWDAGRSRWFGGCFTWSKDPTRILSKQNELAFLTAFGNCVMAEWARIDTEIADQKKSDFIGSISHELRSPLHGILASVEFLEEVLSGWEKQLVETIESCGRTLLDTINHILDFSKINHFESHWRRSKRAKFRAGVPVTVEQSDLPMLNLFQDIDISVICEEVIDSVYAGHVFQNITAQSFNQISDTQGKMSDAQQYLTYAEHITKSRNLQDGVLVILDIDPKNYHVTTQPGALRRLIMNLLGNSLKYTAHGYIIVRLDCHEIEDFVTTGHNGVEESIPRSMLVFTITDTGRGIAPEFLRNKLYIPFAQENILSSGTGLGLSIVRAIVSLLEGEISIDSEVGRGTQVKVSIPVLRKMPQIPVSLEGAADSTKKRPQFFHDAVLDLRSRFTGHKVGLYGFDDITEDSILNEKNRMMKESITNYLVKWYHMQAVPLKEKVDFIIANSANHSTISSLALNAVKVHGNYPCIIVICNQSLVRDRIYTVEDTQCKVGYTAKPIGPTKLAKAMIQTMNAQSTLMVHNFESKEIETSNLVGIIKKDSMDHQGENDKAAEVRPPPKIIEQPIVKLQSGCNDSALHRKSNDIVSKKDTVLTNLDIPKSTALGSQSKSPSILLVDDNQINLRLISTYLSRRAYPCVDTAQNGLEAVQRFEAFSDGYDIIFMDITMPVLDGFGATRKIREMEKKMSSSARKSVTKETMDTFVEQKRKPALIIAFTGRSSTEDQSEAIRSGIDLFMTKPVPFREVGKICDNWIANQIQPDTTTSPC